MKKFVVVFLVSFISQLIFIAIFKISLESDAYVYSEMAIHLIQGEGISQDGVNPALGSSKPGYILFLGLIYKIFNCSMMAEKIIQALLMAASCALTYKIGTELIDEGVGFYSGLIAAIHPALLIISSHMLTETLFTFLLVFAVFFLVKAVRKRSFGAYIFCGILLGLATQVRFTTFFFPLFISIGLLLSYKEKLYPLKVGLAMFLMVIIISIPWGIRNYIHFGYVNPFLEYGGSLWLGSFIKGNAQSDNPETLKAAGDIFYPVKERYYNVNNTKRFYLEVNKAFLASGIKNIKENPIGYIALSPRKIIRLWVGSYSGLFKIAIPFSTFLHNAQFVKQHPFILLWKSSVFLFSLAIFCLGIAGILLGLKMWQKLMPLYLVIGYFILAHIATFSDTRVGIPGLPYLTIFATLGFFSLSDKEGKA